MKFEKWCIHWGGPNSDWWYFSVHRTEKGSRHLGRYDIWYDGPHNSFGLWFISFTWQTKWMGYNEDNIYKLPRWNDWYHPEYGHMRKQ